MEIDNIIEVAKDAIRRGVADESLLRIAESATSATGGPVSRDSLLHIYRRRRRYTGGNELLAQQTEELISFLEGHTADDLLMIEILDHEGASRLFLGTADGPKILHWMRMCDPHTGRRPTEQQQSSGQIPGQIPGQN
ncbi:hypothetical protein [Rhodococcus phenolicus]|uniref:hypothetical protein n=1 Tax=Rhodococcus phenolicus TaxID=263849 RepID=UPI000A6A3AF1|nr:hypothetical protein [Rhodococcus phenolicus]